jgi:hypothetical protein
MAALLDPIDEFKRACQQMGLHYIDFGMGLIVVFHNKKDGANLNIRQYNEDGSCLSSWVNDEDFVQKIVDIITFWEENNNE